MPFKVVTDNFALKFLQTAEMPTGRRAQWIMYLQQFDFEIVHRLGKENKNADALSWFTEVHCYFTGVEIKGGKRSDKNLSDLTSSESENTSLENNDEKDYERDSEDNASIVEISKKRTLPIKNLGKYISKLNEELQEIQQQRRKQEECLNNIDQMMKRIQVIKTEISEDIEPKRSRKAWNLIPNTGSDNKTDSVGKYEENTSAGSSQPHLYCEKIECICNNNQLDEEVNEEVAQENEPYYSEKHAEDIISHYSDN